MIWALRFRYLLTFKVRLNYQGYHCPATSQENTKFEAKMMEKTEPPPEHGTGELCVLSMFCHWSNHMIDKQSDKEFIGNT